MLTREVTIMANIKDNRSQRTAGWLRPGQRFRSEEALATAGGSELTVARIVQDPMGLTHAVLRDSSGREVSTYAEQIRFAIEVGMLSPVGIEPASVAC
jgi:hypothetical protein